MNPLWSWVLALTALVALTLTNGQHRTGGYALLVINQVIWIIYATRTHQYGFYLTATFNLLAFGLAWAKQIASIDE